MERNKERGIENDFEVIHKADALTRSQTNHREKERRQTVRHSERERDTVQERERERQTARQTETEVAERKDRERGIEREICFFFTSETWSRLKLGSCRNIHNRSLSAKDVCLCVRKRERDRETKRQRDKKGSYSYLKHVTKQNLLIFSADISKSFISI